MFDHRPDDSRARVNGANIRSEPRRDARRDPRSDPRRDPHGDPRRDPHGDPRRDPRSDPLRGFLAGAVGLHVLHHAADDDVHGAWLIEELGRHGHRLGPGTLYPLLHRMEATGLLESRSEVVAGHRRRRYRATAAGRRALADGCRAVEELARELLGDRATHRPTKSDPAG